MVSLVRCLPLLAASLLAAAPVSARPGGPPPSSEHRRKAKAYVDAGLIAQNDGDYDGAITLYQKAYALVPHPALLFNMAQAHRLAGRHSQALALYRQYVAEVSTGDLSAQALEWIAEIEREAARQESAQPPSAVSPARPDVVAPSEVVAPPPPAAPSQDRAPDRGRTWRIAGIATAGAGAATIAVGGLFGLRAKSISDDLSEPGATWDPEKDEDGKAAERTMFVLYGVGGALVVGGIAAYLLHRHTDEETAAVGVTAIPSGAAFTVSGRF